MPVSSSAPIVAHFIQISTAELVRLHGFASHTCNMSRSLYWMVFSHHVNVGAGDCSIHVVVLYPDNRASKCVLIDGGSWKYRLNSSKTKIQDPRPIDRAVQWLSTQYQWDDGCQFDTIIISHWDEDHWGGVLQTISEDIAMSSNQRAPYLKYHPDGTPATMLYCPNWSFQSRPRVNGAPVGKIDRHGSFAYINTKWSSKKDAPNWVPFCQFRTAQDALGDVLGVDFFTNAKPSMDIRQVRSLAMLAQCHNSKVEPYPGHTTDTPPAPRMLCLAVLEQLPGQGFTVIRKEISLTNRYSIVCIIYWPDTQRISHFLAGDLDQTNESRVIAWIIQGGHSGHITSMKLSHHGASGSTPLDMIYMTTPFNLIISNPSGGYVHPSWEIILFLYLFTKYPTRAEARGRWVLATKYPHFFATQASTAGPVYQKLGMIKLGTFKDAAVPPYQRFWDFLAVRYAILNGYLPPGQKLQTDLDWFRALPATMTESQKKMCLLEQLAERWRSVFNPLAECHPAWECARLYPELRDLTRSNSIECIVVVSANDDAWDGAVDHKFYNWDWSFEYARNIWQMDIDLGMTATKANAAAGDSVQAFPSSAGAGTSTASTSVSVIQGPYADAQLHDPNEEDDTRMDVDQVPTFLPALRAPTPPVQPPLQDVEGGFYFYASTVASEKISVSSYHSLTSNSPIDAFVGALHCRNIGVESADPPRPGDTLALQPGDEFGYYFTKAFGLQSFAIVSVEGPSIGGFVLAMSPPGGTGQPADAKLLWFTTEAVEDAFGSSTPLGIIPDYNILTLGLDTRPWQASETTSTMTLLQLVQLAQLRSWTASPAVTALKDLSLVLTKGNTQRRRNALWFEPRNSYRATLRLEYDLDDTARQDLQGYLQQYVPEITIQSASVIARNVSSWAPGRSSDPAVNTPNARVTFSGSLTFLAQSTVAGISFDTVIEAHPTHLKLLLILHTRADDALKRVFTFFQQVLGGEGDPLAFTGWFTEMAGSTGFDPPSLRRIELLLNGDASAPDLYTPTAGVSRASRIGGLCIDMETRARFGPSALTAVFLLTYQWNTSSEITLAGKLWCAPLTDLEAMEARKMLPDYEPYNVLQPVTLGPTDPWPSTLDLTKVAGFENVPQEIPSQISQVGLTIASDGIYFTGAALAKPPSSPAVPTLSLDQLDLSLSYLWGQPESIEASLSLQATIAPDATAANGSLTLVFGQVCIENGQWKLYATAGPLYGSTLAQFFDAASRTAVTPILDQIEIRALFMEYDYVPRGDASQFTFGGTLLLGGLPLALNFTHSALGWTFKANLDLENLTDPDPAMGAISIGQIAGNLLGGELELPAFITDVTISRPQTSDAVGIQILPLADLTVDKPLLFMAWLEVDGLSLQAIQYQPGTPQGATARPGVQRVFMLSISQLPHINIPLVGDLAQPFDEMLFVYVQPQKGTAVKGGLTYSEVTLINRTLGDPLTSPQTKQLPWKITKNAYQNDDVVLQAGAHFLLVRKDDTGTPTVVLDYVFNQPSSTGSGSQSSNLAVISSDENDNATPEDPGSAKTPYAKRIGPLSIQNMGLQYQAGPTPVLSILIDASIALGPLQLELIGFSLSLTFQSGFNLRTLPPVGFSLHGLAVAFDRSPVLVDGMLEHVVQVQSGETTDSYQGAVGVSYQPYLFEAAGYYGQTVSKAGPFLSVFVYFVLNGPLVNLELAEINTVTGGFGYNTNLRFPTVDTVQQFPFIAGTDASDPNSALTTLLNGEWFFPQSGFFWLAAGLTVLAFEILQVQAVAVVEWDPKLQLGLFGVATADVPASDISGNDKFAHLELGLVSTMDLEAGVLTISGQLSPASFVLNPSCHLTGGFALYKQFSCNDDWVFTVGGYHRAFDRPSQYPNPPRLAISWAYDTSISIRGEAYFAITPKVCMGGGRLDVSLSLGPLEAFFDAYADFLLNYEPFHFTAEGGLAVGVRFTFNLWICTVHVNVEIGAMLYLRGPPMAGRVHVNFWLMGFDIDFGPSTSTSTAGLTLDQFYSLALQQRSQGAAATANDSLQPHVFSCNRGLIPSQSAVSDPNSSLWMVRGAVFQFTISCKFAFGSANVVTVQPDSSESPVTFPGNGNPIHARPMKVPDALSSVLTVRIRPIQSVALTAIPDSNQVTSPLWDTGNVVVKSVPTGLWGACKL